MILCQLLQLLLHKAMVCNSDYTSGAQEGYKCYTDRGHSATIFYGSHRNSIHSQGHSQEWPQPPTNLR